MWQLNEKSRKIFYDIIGSTENALSKKIRLPDGKDGPTLSEIIKRDRIDAHDVEAIYRCLSEDLEFHKFVDSLIFSEPRQSSSSGKSVEETDKYNDRIRRLKEAQENREYMEMTKSVDQHLNNNLLHDFGKVNPYRNLTKDFSVAHKNVKLANLSNSYQSFYDPKYKMQSLTKVLLKMVLKDLRSVNRQMIAVINTLLTVGGAFAFGFFGINMAYSHLNLDIATRMLLGLFFGTIVFFADIYFIVKNMDQL